MARHGPSRPRREKPRPLSVFEMACCCGMTCWRRLHAWQQDGLWFALHQVLLGELDDAEKTQEMQFAFFNLARALRCHRFP